MLLLWMEYLTQYTYKMPPHTQGKLGMIVLDTLCHDPSRSILNLYPFSIFLKTLLKVWQYCPLAIIVRKRSENKRGPTMNLIDP